MSRLCRLKTKTHGEDGQWAYEEITKLREQVAAQAAEIARLKTVPMKYRRMQFNAELQEEVARLREQVKAQAADIRTLEIEFGDVRDSFLLYKEKTQAQAAVIEKLREALTACVCAMQDHQAGIGITEIFDKSEALGRKILVIPADSKDILAEVRRAERERVAQMILNGRFLHDESPAAQFAKEVAAAIRAME